jgi:MFS family permease
VFGLSPFGLLTFHYVLYQLSVALAGGFVGAYLLKLGFSLPAALVLYAALLVMRFGLRFLALAVVRRLGLRAAMMAGAALAALQFLPLMLADNPAGLLAWLLVVSLAESLYWPVYHSAAAVIGGASRGRELGTRTALGALVGVLGPLAGGLLLSHFGPTVDFAVAGLLTLLSILPLGRLREVSAGPIPDLSGSMRFADRAAIATFAADGWMASGLAMAWPMVLFLSLGSHYESFGVANAMAGLVGAATGILCGRAVDRGERDRYLVLVCAALALGFLLRVGAGWSPLAAVIANATGAAVTGLYVPVLMSVIYDRAKQTGEAYRFHFSAEAGWDVGAASGCLVAALLSWATGLPSLAVLPAALGVLGIYWCLRSRPVPVAPVLLPQVRAA